MCLFCCWGYHKWMDGILPENLKVLIYWLSRVEYMLKGRQGDHNILFKKMESSGISARSISYSSCWRQILSMTRFSMAFNGFSKNAGFLDLILNSVSYFSLRDKQWPYSLPISTEGYKQRIHLRMLEKMHKILCSRCVFLRSVSRI